MKKLLTVLALILTITTSFSQVVLDDAQLFGSSRSLDAKIIDAGVISDNSYNFVLPIKNNDLVDMKLTAVVLPQGVSVMFSKNTVSPNEQVEVIATVNKSFMRFYDDKNSFMENIDIIVEEKLMDDLTTRKMFSFVLKGQFK